MARPIWKGHLSFGLVMIPVTLYAAESPKGELSFTMLDERDHSRIKYKRVNEGSGEEVPWKSIVKGHELPDGGFVIVTAADFKKAAVRLSKVVEISDFVSRDEIEPTFFEKPYYLEPAPGGEKVYALLRETLKRTKKVGVATVVIHTRQYLGAVLPEDSALVLNTLRYPDELRSPAELHLPDAKSPQFKPAPRELEMAEKLIEQMSAKWDPSRYHDEYREQLKRWIEQKAKSGRVTAAAMEEEPALVSYNIMDLLKKSVEETRRGERKPAAPKKTRHRKAG